MSYYEDDDYDNTWGETAAENGWLSEDSVALCKELLRHVEFQTRPGNISDAALILLEHELNPPLAVAPEDPNVTWAKHLMKDILT